MSSIPENRVEIQPPTEGVDPDDNIRWDIEFFNRKLRSNCRRPFDPVTRDLLYEAAKIAFQHNDTPDPDTVLSAIPTYFIRTKERGELAREVLVIAQGLETTDKSLSWKSLYVRPESMVDIDYSKIAKMLGLPSKDKMSLVNDNLMVVGTALLTGIVEADRYAQLYMSKSIRPIHLVLGMCAKSNIINSLQLEYPNIMLNIELQAFRNIPLPNERIEDLVLRSLTKPGTGNRTVMHAFKSLN